VRLSDSFAESLIRGGGSVLSSFNSFSLPSIYTSRTIDSVVIIIERVRSHQGFAGAGEHSLTVGLLPRSAPVRSGQSAFQDKQAQIRDARHIQDKKTSPQ
jgi:hypothetical protein